MQLTRELAQQIAADYPALQSLNLGGNALRDVRHLQHLPRSLTQLNLGGNQLVSLPWELPQWLPKLQLLTLRGNALESLRPLQLCEQLQTLDMGENRVQLVSELRFLQGSEQLRHLALDGNPIAASAKYRREVLAMLPQLQTLDGVEVTAAEKLYAKLQLKTQATGHKTPTTSPTRLLTPESVKRASRQEEASRVELFSSADGESDTKSVGSEPERRAPWGIESRGLRVAESELDRVEQVQDEDFHRSRLSPPRIAVAGRPPTAEVETFSPPKRIRRRNDDVWMRQSETDEKRDFEMPQRPDRQTNDYESRRIQAGVGDQRIRSETNDMQDSMMTRRQDHQTISDERWRRSNADDKQGWRRWSEVGKRQNRRRRSEMDEEQAFENLQDVDAKQMPDRQYNSAETWRRQYEIGRRKSVLKTHQSAHQDNSDTIGKSRSDGQDIVQPVLNKIQQIPAADLSRETLLQSRVEALEAIMAVQDKTMRHSLVQFGKQHANTPSPAGTANIVPPVEVAANVYTYLLATWREKCISLMVQARSDELVLEASKHECRQQQAQAREARIRCQEQQEMWRQRVVDVEAQRDLEVVAAREAQDERAQANTKAVQAVRRLALERERVQHLGEIVAKFTGGLVRDKVEQLRNGASRLEAIERRLVFAKERVELAATLVTHREARLRNSEAALEAERRVWANRLEQQHNSKLLEQSTNNESKNGAAKASSTSGGKMLRPVTETALRSLFHRLDAYGMGMVRSQTLVQALRRGDPEVLRAVGGPKKLAKLVAHVEAAIRKLSGAGGGMDTLTWGEFLLLFIPESSVSLFRFLEEDGSTGNGAESTFGYPDRSCELCTAIRNEDLPTWPFDGPTDDPTNQITVAPAPAPKERRKLQALSHAELVQQIGALLADRSNLQRLVLRDAHDLRTRVRSVRREWELKARELAYQKDVLQRKLDDRTEELHKLQVKCSSAEAAQDEALAEVSKMREELLTQQNEFAQRYHKLETGNSDRLRHEQEVWQTELQDARLAHTLLQADHSKQQVRIRQLERDLARQKEALLAHETERVASLEEKVRRRDAELAKLRRERNTILNSLRDQERKLAVMPPPPEPVVASSIATQTMPTEQKTSSTQTTATEPKDSGRMSIFEISTDKRLRKDDEGDPLDRRDPKPRHSRAVNGLSPEEVNLRLQKLQSLTENLLAD